MTPGRGEHRDGSRSGGIGALAAVPLDWRAATFAAMAAVVLAVVPTLVTADPLWRTGLFLASDGLWLVPSSLLLLLALRLAYRHLFGAAIVFRGHASWVRARAHPLWNLANAAPVVAPIVVTVVGRGRLVVGTAALVMCLVFIAAWLEFFRRRSRELMDGELIEEIDDGVRLYWAGALTVTLTTLFVMANLVLASEDLPTDGLILVSAAGVALATATAYIGLFAGWVPSTPVTDVPLRLAVVATWPLLATPALTPSVGWRPLILALGSSAFFVATNEPIRRRVKRRAAQALSEQAAHRPAPRR